MGQSGVRRSWRYGIVVASAVVAVVTVVGCSGSSKKSGQSSSNSSSSSSSSTSGAPSSAGPSAPSTTAKSTSSSAPQSNQTGGLSTVPSRSQSTKAPVKPTQTASFGTGVTVRISKTVKYNATGHGPGEVSGPAIRFTLAMRNGTGKTMSVANVTVTADYGADHTPASSLSDSSCAGFHGSVRNGATAAGNYCFTIPSNERTYVTLTISYSANAPVVQIRGSVQ